MSFYMQSYISPVPEVVLKNYKKYVEPHKNMGRKVIFAPHGELVFNLVYRGLFLGFDVVGALDRNPKKIGRSGNGLYAYSYDDLISLKPDIVVVANTRYHTEIYNSLCDVALAQKFELVDLCEGYDHLEFRHEIAMKLDCREIEKLRPGCVDVPATITSACNMNVEVVVETGWGLGDKLCAMVAAREFARRNPGLKVFFNTLPAVVSAYSDDLLHLGSNTYPLPENYALFHREKDSSPAGNYLGCYYLGLGMAFNENPVIDLPDVPSLDGLESGTYIALQPTANWAKPNFSVEDLVRIIKSSPLPVVLTGTFFTKNSTELVTEDERVQIENILISAGARASFIGDEMNMLKIIRHAALVVTPRSASAHIAAGYGVKTVVWVPSDGENWHLDYPGWKHARVSVHQEDAIGEIISKIKYFLQYLQ
ncbi:hypothetical protein RI534_01915 [Aeromonas allosaccharophila]|uniref:hypothetical protein n=1 Tax=Aeromonas allosaccharophila TaxID=656 RepID=UPI0034137009